MVTTINSYDVGALVRVAVAFTVDTIATDPTTVSASAIDPLGAVRTLTPIKDSVGNYHALVDLTAAYPGIWTYRWTGTGACQAAEEDTFYVEKSAFS